MLIAEEVVGPGSIVTLATLAAPLVMLALPSTPPVTRPIVPVIANAGIECVWLFTVCEWEPFDDVAVLGTSIE